MPFHSDKYIKLTMTVYATHL